MHAHLVAVQHGLDHPPKESGRAFLIHRGLGADDVEEVAPCAQLLYDEDVLRRLEHVLRIRIAESGAPSARGV